MKILLISDTHGAHIELISAYAEEMKADICIHAGDFGFYDQTSADAMSQRELFLLIKHCALPEDEKEELRGFLSEEEFDTLFSANGKKPKFSFRLSKLWKKLWDRR